MRSVSLASSFLALVFFVGFAGAEDKPAKAAKNQMVKGTIKSVDVEKSLLIVNQKVKKETVERQLDIKSDTKFLVTIEGKTKEALGKEGLELLVGKEGAQVAVKCDKDVNVLQVKAMLKK
jgi:hypothetical protein